MNDVQIQPQADGSERLTRADGSASLLLVPRLGLAEPRYHFHVGRVVHAAKELGLFRVQTTLLLGNDLTGQAELTEFSATQPNADFAPLIAAAQARLRAEPARFGPRLVAELPGWRDAAGQSPFWQALGARFYRGDPDETEQRLGPGWRSHLAALLPRQTIYLSFLGEAAERVVQEALCGEHPARPALRAAGFTATSHVRIDDAGSVLAWRDRAALPPE